MKTLERLNESKLTVVIPTFNEVENIPLILKKIEDTLKNVNFEIKISQIVKLYKSGKPYRMSKRAGDFILAKDFKNLCKT